MSLISEPALPGWMTADTITTQAELDWYAVRVMSNRERVVAGFLNGKGIEACVPLYAPGPDPHTRRKERVLFPGYVFCSFDASKLLPIVTVPGVVGIVCSGRKPAAVEPHEMRAIMRLMESGLPSEPYPYLSAGERVRVRLGPMTGVEGVLIREGRHDRIVISVSLLMSSVMVEIERAFVEPVSVRSHVVRQVAVVSRS
jgi:transcription antitermination factor NusG